MRGCSNLSSSWVPSRAAQGQALQGRMLPEAFCQVRLLTCSYAVRIRNLGIRSQVLCRNLLTMVAPLLWGTWKNPTGVEANGARGDSPHRRFQPVPASP